MAWRVSYLSRPHAVEMHISGTLTPGELKDCVVSLLEEARVRGTQSFLCDARQLVGGHSVFDLYALAENLQAMGLPTGAREAIILPTAAERAQEVTFWENACANRGFEVRCFDTREEAQAWLESAALARTGT